MAFNHKDIDSKWQKRWADSKAFASSTETKDKPKYYALDMFPYPSGAGLHVGHLACYTPTEILSRYKRVKGFNVLHPMGYDAFGLPAEQYAIQTGIHPAVTTQKTIDNFRRQLQAYGFSFDWEREISTCDPSYYKWTQFIFTKLWEKGLAYQKEAPVNWCPALRTVLANEEVVDGKSERGGHPVIRMPMKQWILKITAYAERLLNDLDKLDWPERTKEAQRNWIGKSEGAEISFAIQNSTDSLKVFTTRPDTIFGVSFMVLAPEHPLVAHLTTADQKSAVDAYVQKSARKSEIERKANQEKSGQFTGSFAVHPLTKKPIPIWISDYVLMDYGTGAIMAVPGHDERDYDFALKIVAPFTRQAPDQLVLRVLTDSKGSMGFEGLPYIDDGKLVNSDFLNGLDKNAAVKKAIQEIESKNLGKKLIQYKLRDWLFSRQRYWGEPFPMVELEDGSLHALSVEELPVALPEVADYEPSEKGEPPLARVTEWVKYNHKGKHGKRITDTMPGSAGSSWYFLRYTDPKNEREAFSFQAQNYWMPVDLYVGGAEHTVGHLLYARFWQKVLFDCGLVTHDEPFQKLVHQGMILGSDGEKMSKSRGNTVSPDEVREEYGADAVRMYMSFLGPVEKDKPWATNGIEGVRRFLDRVWRLVCAEDGQVHVSQEPPSAAILKLTHKTLKKVGDDIETMSSNTAISAMMILVNELYKANEKPKSTMVTLTQMLMPFAPHLAEELWQKLGQSGFVSLAPWPEYDKSLIADDTITMGVQVNGKMRGTVELPVNASEEQAVQAALQVGSVIAAMAGKPASKVIYKAGRILNLIC